MGPKGRKGRGRAGKGRGRKREGRGKAEENGRAQRLSLHVFQDVWTFYLFLAKFKNGYNQKNVAPLIQEPEREPRARIILDSPLSKKDSSKRSRSPRPTRRDSSPHPNRSDSSPHPRRERSPTTFIEGSPFYKRERSPQPRANGSPKEGSPNREGSVSFSLKREGSVPQKRDSLSLPRKEGVFCHPTEKKEEDTQ
jgi:hypothetical protein